MSQVPASPHIILVAGLPRSGSTWLFNAVRLLLSEANIANHSVWVADWERDHPAPIHVVKAHRQDQVDFSPDIVLTTRRPAEECLASLVRMGWLKNEPEAIRNAWRNHQSLMRYWQSRSTLETDYSEMTGDPQRALTRLAALLRVSIPDPAILLISNELETLRAPTTKGGYDPVTLLHPGHRNMGNEGSPGSGDILRIVLPSNE